jgi:hypothetical protein
MPEGNRANLAPAPRPADGWQLGEPDLIVTMPVPYTLPAGDTDIFRIRDSDPGLTDPAGIFSWSSASSSRPCAGAGTSDGSAKRKPTAA